MSLMRRTIHDYTTRSNAHLDSAERRLHQARKIIRLWRIPIRALSPNAGKSARSWHNKQAMSISTQLPKGAPETFGLYFFAKRVAAGLSVESLMVLLGVGRDTVRGWEADQSFPEPRFWPKLRDSIPNLEVRMIEIYNSIRREHEQLRPEGKAAKPIDASE